MKKKMKKEKKIFLNFDFFFNQDNIQEFYVVFDSSRNKFIINQQLLNLLIQLLQLLHQGL